MKSFVIILSCLAALTAANPAQDVIVGFLANGRITCRVNCRADNPIINCPRTTCPRASRDGTCGLPNCQITANRAWLHPHRDPNFYYQCTPLDALGNWGPIEMPCACETLFSSVKNCCVHPHEWSRECQIQPITPIIPECTEGCGPNGDVDDPTQPPPPPPPPPPPTPPPVGPPGDNCNCPCAPCIWWPCMPCLSACPCQNQQQRPQNPWQQPQTPSWQRPQTPSWQPPRTPSWQPTQTPSWQPPQTPSWQQPHNPWQRPG